MQVTADEGQPPEGRMHVGVLKPGKQCSSGQVVHLALRQWPGSDRDDAPPVDCHPGRTFGGLVHGVNDAVRKDGPHARRG